MNSPQPFDMLQEWKLTLPIAATGSDEALEIKTPALLTYRSEWFQRDGNVLTFVVPTDGDGATTPNSENRRTEFRQRTPDGTSDIYWPITTGVLLRGTYRVSGIPTALPGFNPRMRTVIQQIHGEDKELCRVCYEDVAGLGKLSFADEQHVDGGERWTVLRDSAGNGTAIKRGEWFDLTMEADKTGTRVTAIYNGVRYTGFSKLNPVWLTDRFYAKTGNYVQNGDTDDQRTGNFVVQIRDLQPIVQPHTIAPLDQPAPVPPPPVVAVPVPVPTPVPDAALAGLGYTVTKHRTEPPEVTIAVRGDPNDAAFRALAAKLLNPTPTSMPAPPVETKATPGGWINWTGREVIPRDSGLYAVPFTRQERINLLAPDSHLAGIAAKCKASASELVGLIRLVTWFGNDQAPPNDPDLFVQATALDRSGVYKPMWVPRWDLELFWMWHLLMLDNTRARLRTAGVTWSAMRIDGGGLGGETGSYSKLKLPNGDPFPTSMRPTDAHRLRIAKNFIQVFGARGLMLASDEPALVRDGFALDPHIGLWRASLGRIHFLNGLQSDGILDLVLQRMRNPLAVFELECYGENSPIDPFMARDHVRLFRQAGPAQILVGAGNFGRLNGVSMDQWDRWNADQQGALLEIGRLAKGL